MRLFRWKRGKTKASCSFGQYQIYVCDLENLNGDVQTGITVLPGDSVVELPFVLSASEAHALAAYLDSLQGGSVPSRHRLRNGLRGLFMNVYFKFRRMDGDTLKGRISVTSLLGIEYRLASASKATLAHCAAALRDSPANA